MMKLILEMTVKCRFSWYITHQHEKKYIFRPALTCLWFYHSDMYMPHNIQQTRVVWKEAKRTGSGLSIPVRKVVLVASFIFTEMLDTFKLMLFSWKNFTSGTFSLYFHNLTGEFSKLHQICIYSRTLMYKTSMLWYSGDIWALLSHFTPEKSQDTRQRSGLQMQRCLWTCTPHDSETDHMLIPQG